MGDSSVYSDEGGAHSHDSVILDNQGDEKIVILDATAILAKYDYEIAKWVANCEFKRNKKTVDEEMARHDRLEHLTKTSALGAISDYVMGGQTVQRENQSILINEYWSAVSIDVKYKGLSRQQIRGLLIIQNAFRTWIKLKRHREVLKSKATEAATSFGENKSIATSLYVQSAVRRVIAKMTVETKISENKQRDKIFAKFCGIMKAGVTVTMFSRKYGTAPMRVISFDKDLNNLTFSTSFGTRGKIALKSIYKIHKGISETMYPHSRQAQLSRCICLECLGERVVDLELANAQQAREMFIGFERLILLLSGTKSPFYIDNFGIPRRAGPSIIENAIDEATLDGDTTDLIYKSKPDEMRFWGAVRQLQQEYDTWQVEQDAERREHRRLKDIEAENIANKLNEREKSTIDERGGRKAVKLVRFVDSDGVNQIVEEAEKIALRRASLDNLNAVVENTKREKKRGYDEESKSTNSKWNPFKKKEKKGKSESEHDDNASNSGGFNVYPFMRNSSKHNSEKSSEKDPSEIDFEKVEEKVNVERNRLLALDALGASSSDDLNDVKSKPSFDTSDDEERSRKYSVLSHTSYDLGVFPPAGVSQTLSGTIPNPSTTPSIASDSPKAYSVSLRGSQRSMSDVSTISKSSVTKSIWNLLFCQLPMYTYESDDDYAMMPKNDMVTGGIDRSTGYGSGSGSDHGDEGDDSGDESGESSIGEDGEAETKRSSVSSRGGKILKGLETSSIDDEDKGEESGEEKDEDSSHGSSAYGGKSSHSTFSGHVAYDTEEEGAGEEKRGKNNNGDEEGYQESVGDSSLSRSTCTKSSYGKSSQSTFSSHAANRYDDEEDEDEDGGDGTNRNPNNDSDSFSEDDGSDAPSEDAVADGTSSDDFDEDD